MVVYEWIERFLGQTVAPDDKYDPSKQDDHPSIFDTLAPPPPPQGDDPVKPSSEDSSDGVVVETVSAGEEEKEQMSPNASPPASGTAEK